MEFRAWYKSQNIPIRRLIESYRPSLEGMEYETTKTNFYRMKNTGDLDKNRKWHL